MVVMEYQQFGELILKQWLGVFYERHVMVLRYFIHIGSDDSYAKKKLNFMLVLWHY